jgi:hypothetical protein
MKLRLLKLVPEFQRDVAKLRNQLGIAPKTDGYASGHDYIGESMAWLSEHNVPTFRDLALIPASKEALAHPFHAGVIALGEKFRLPYNFYNDTLHGIALYVLTNRIIAPSSNWEIDSDRPNASRKPRWVGIRVYAPLTAGEATVAFETLTKIYPSLIGYHESANRHARIELEDNLPIVEEMIQRHGSPKRRKKYIGYLAYAEKQGELNSDSKRRKLEKTHPSDVIVDYDKLTSKEIGKRRRKSADVARKALERLDKSAIKIFGYGLKDTDTSSDT